MMRKLFARLFVAVLALSLAAFAQPAEAKAHRASTAKRAAAVKAKHSRRAKAGKSRKKHLSSQDANAWVVVKPTRRHTGERVEKASKSKRALRKAHKKSRKARVGRRSGKTAKKLSKKKSSRAAARLERKSRRMTRAQRRAAKRAERKAAKGGRAAARKSARKAETKTSRRAARKASRKVARRSSRRAETKAERRAARKAARKAARRAGRRRRATAVRSERTNSKITAVERKFTSGSIDLRRPDDLSVYSVRRPGQKAKLPAEAVVPEVRQQVRPAPSGSSAPTSVAPKAGEGRF